MVRGYATTVDDGAAWIRHKVLINVYKCGRRLYFESTTPKELGLLEIVNGLKATTLDFGFLRVGAGPSYPYLRTRLLGDQSVFRSLDEHHRINQLTPQSFLSVLTGFEVRFRLTQSHPRNR